MDIVDIFKKEKEKLVMDFLKGNGLYDYLVKKMNEIYELPIKPDDPYNYLLNNLETLSYDREFLVNEVHRLKKDND